MPDPTTPSDPASDTFTLASVHGGARLELRGAIPRGLEGYDGATYVAVLSGRVRATVEVYDVRPQDWSTFFAELAASRQGWTGARTYESVDHALRLSCTIDRLGHVAVRVFLRGDATEDDWRVESTLALESGQLDDIAHAAAAYFGTASR